MLNSHVHCEKVYNCPDYPKKCNPDCEDFKGYTCIKERLRYIPEMYVTEGNNPI